LKSFSIRPKKIQPKRGKTGLKSSVCIVVSDVMCAGEKLVIICENCRGCGDFFERGGGNYDKNKKAEQNLKLNIYTNEKKKWLMT
jgi:hypothetical protein